MGAPLRASLERRARLDALADEAAAFGVRPMRAEDVDAVVSIETEAFTSPWQRGTFLELLGRSTVELLVMEHRSLGIIGYAVLWCVLDQGELANLAIVPSLRGQGLGTRLLAHVLETARGRGVETVYLEVRESNAPALQLYERFGFSQVGVRRGYYDRPKEDARILMARL
ncbi:MAG: ribosomal-protein-alanine N-acetyltransferase [Gemmatimonadetes bacterium]|nr:ribosomal-protein-alanine N-acetyltransferase [Gemmatimonadota bacterium]